MLATRSAGSRECLVEFVLGDREASHHQVVHEGTLSPRTDGCRLLICAVAKWAEWALLPLCPGIDRVRYGDRILA